MKVARDGQQETFLSLLTNKIRLFRAFLRTAGKIATIMCLIYSMKRFCRYSAKAVTFLEAKTKNNTYLS